MANLLSTAKVCPQHKSTFGVHYRTGSPGQLGLRVAGFPGHCVAGSRNVTQFHVWSVNCRSGLSYRILHTGTLEQCQCQCQSEIFNVAKTAELVRSPRRRSRVTELSQEKTDEKGMFSDVDGRRAETGMNGCQMAIRNPA